MGCAAPSVPAGAAHKAGSQNTLINTTKCTHTLTAKYTQLSTHNIGGRLGFIYNHTEKEIDFEASAKVTSCETPAAGYFNPRVESGLETSDLKNVI